MYDIVMFGTGPLAGVLASNTKHTTNIIAYVNTTNTVPSAIDGVPVVDIKGLNNLSYDYIVIATSQVKNAFDVLACGGVPRNKIVGYSFIRGAEYATDFFQTKIDELLNELVCNADFERLFDIPKKKFFICGMNILEDYSIIEGDYVREQTLKLISEQILRKDIPGEVAELGVFKGGFAKKINKAFPERTLFLYDTFEGFDLSDIENEKKLKWENLHAFDSTNVDYVLSKMPYADKCVVKKGFFPKTFNEDNKRFCFVSLDADLYNPILSGLDIFYPRLSEGGYIMVHDYNTIAFSGAKEAVRDYCDSRNISYVPIPDIAGSIVITK